MPEEILNILLLILLAVAFIIPQIIKSAKKRDGVIKKPPLNFGPQEEEEWPITHEKRFDPVTGERLTSHYDAELLEEQKARAEFNEDLTKRKLEINIKSAEELSHLEHLKSNIEESGKRKSQTKEPPVLRKSEAQLEDKLNRLSPLKRAIVMSEILKPPKGLE